MNTVYILLLLWCLASLSLSLAETFRHFPRTYSRQRIRGRGFYDENEYDDAYAEYTGAEKRTLSEMQRRRFQNVQEDDEEEVKGENIRDLLLRELARGEDTETSDEEYPHRMETDDFSDDENNFDASPDGNSQYESFKDQIEDGVGTARDDLALKREEEKQKRIQMNKRLPKNGDLFEEDMVMDQRLRSWVTGDYDKRDAINDVTYLWPASDDGTVRVPYTLSDEIQNDPEKMDSIQRAIAAFNKYTCIRYVQLEDNEEDIEKRGIVLDRAKFIINSSMCYSSVGRQGGKQDISIGNGCERVGTVIHEMMHTIGFIHEQSRPDRDDYVKVFYNHIKPDMKHNFEKYSRGEVKTLPVNKKFYDFDSCLHYNNFAFTKDGQDTIQSLEDPDRRFGQRKSFSKHDIEQINEEYKCNVPGLSEKMEDIPYE